MKSTIYGVVWILATFIPWFLLADWAAAQITDHWLADILWHMGIWLILLNGSHALFLDILFRKQWGHSLFSRDPAET